MAHNDFGTKLPNYQLSQVFSHFFWKMYRKSCQVTYFTKLLAFLGGKTLHKLPNCPNYRGFNFWERPKVAHIEPYLNQRGRQELCWSSRRTTPSSRQSWQGRCSCRDLGWFLHFLPLGTKGNPSEKPLPGGQPWRCRAGTDRTVD